MSALPSLAHPAQNIFTAGKKNPARVENFSAIAILNQVTPASRLAMRPAPELVSSGILKLDELTGGLPRGCMSEIYGPASSGRSSLLIAALAAATRRQETFALVDVSDAFDPSSAAAAGINFQQLLWVRCGNQISSYKTRKEGALAQALRATDLLLQSGGFGMVAIDLCDVPFKEARRIPLASWFRFQRAVEHTPTVLLVLASEPLAQTCAALLLKVAGQKQSSFSPPLCPSHARLVQHLEITAEIIRSRMERKPVCSATASFATTTVRTG